MTDRYYAAAPWGEGPLCLQGPEAHHLIHVMRARLGDEVTLFDGHGGEASARVTRIGRAEAELAILARQEVDRECRVRIVLAMPLPKGERQRWLVEKAVELGVARLIPLSTARSEQPATAAAIARLERAVIEACKQCGRNQLMPIEPARELRQLLADAPPDAARLLANTGGQNVREALDAAMARISATNELFVAVGPEGGFAEAELALARAHGWTIVDLGPRTLRVETAALALAALVVLRHGD